MASTKPGKRPWLRRLVLAGLILAAYPAFVLASVYAHWFAADLPGGRNGPADAYRHALASASLAARARRSLVSRFGAGCRS